MWSSASWKRTAGPRPPGLIDGIEQIPRRTVGYQTTTLLEFDLIAALARRPGLLLVDELAHTNAPGSRHEKRWQDVESPGRRHRRLFDVERGSIWSSLTDVVAVITGVVVQETVPDLILERADGTRRPAAGRTRQSPGKAGAVPPPEQAERAVENFFRPGNLSALRELALRRTAERVDAQMRSYMQEHSIQNPWPTAERILVCSPTARSAPDFRARRPARGLAAQGGTARGPGGASDGREPEGTAYPQGIRRQSRRRGPAAGRTARCGNGRAEWRQWPRKS